MELKLEVIAFNLDCCIKIEEAGAHRIELCANPSEGGTTPSHGFITAARKNVSIELFPIIRPRGGDFLYDDGEFEIMKEDIGFCKKTGCDGVVIGILNADGSVDKKRCRILAEIAYPMSVTFHRAFDRTADLFHALEDIIDIGCQRILSSGMKRTAIEGTDIIQMLVKKADDRIIIMPGSGIRADNLMEIVNSTGATEFHSSARKERAARMDYLNRDMGKEPNTTEVDQDEVKKMLTVLKGFA